MSAATAREPGTGATAPAATAAEVRRLAGDLLPRATEVAAVITEHVLQIVPELAPAGTADAVRLVRESTDQNIGAMLSTLAFGVAPSGLEAPAGTQELMRNLTAGGGDVTHLLRAYRVGHQLLWKLWSEHVTADGRDGVSLADVLAVSSEHLFAFIDSACQRIVESAELAVPGGRTSGAADRHEVVATLLGTDSVDLHAAGTDLGYDLSRHHVALIVAPLRQHADVRAELDALVAGVAAQPFLLPDREGGWWAWLGFPTPPAPQQLDRLAEHRPESVVVGMGEPAAGRAGFRRSLAQAREALRVARLREDPLPGVTRSRDIEVVALLCSDPEQARALAADRLGGLASRDETGRRLRQTVRALFAHGHNRGRAAAVLHVHHKTVAYRLSQVEELLGRSLSEDTYDLATALLVDAALHGP